MTQWSDFFKIVSLENIHPNYVIVIELNPDHKIFKCHFPGNPVVPGVCMVQILKEILKNIYNKDFTMKQASQLKFLAVVNPNINRTLHVNLSVLKEDAGGIVVSGTFNKDELIFLKYKITVVET